jgi:hypothetical protein
MKLDSNRQEFTTLQTINHPGFNSISLASKNTNSPGHHEFVVIPDQGYRVHIHRCTIGKSILIHFGIVSIFQWRVYGYCVMTSHSIFLASSLISPAARHCPLIAQSMR